MDNIEFWGLLNKLIIVFSIKVNSSKEKGSLGNDSHIILKVLTADIWNSTFLEVQAPHKIFIKFGHPWSFIEIIQIELTKVHADSLIDGSVSPNNPKELFWTLVFKSKLIFCQFS